MRTEKTINGPESPPAGLGTQMQLLTFEVAGECFAVEIHAVREIDRLMDITRVPKSPPGIAGVINLRGTIIPVVRLRTTFGFPGASDGEQTRIIVLGNEGRETGFIVDRVHEVLRVESSAVDPTPEATGTVDADVIRGIATLEDRLLIVLDVEKLFAELDLSSLDLDEAA